MIIDVRIGDNDNREFELITEVEISNIDWLVYKDSMNTCNPNEYDKSWYNICCCVEDQVHNLPYGWYVDILTK